MKLEHEPFPKLPRLNREWIITEKIDGTNVAVGVKLHDGDGPYPGEVATIVTADDDQSYAVYAQSRNKLIEPTKTEDPFGFARYVREHAQAFASALGEGLHFGEWYGSKIQRTYGLTDGERYFALFNVDRWTHDEPSPYSPKPQLAYVPNLTTVPVIGVMPLKFDTAFVERTLEGLRSHGSFATGADGFDRPEGVCLYSTAANISFKVTLEKDEKPKGQP